jgi:TRAP-type mannitol/chloroaromatic compound transport system permease small subunit
MKKLGYVVSYLILPMTLIIVVTAVMRYAFSNAPKWGFEVGLFLYGTHLILGGSITHLSHKHVTVDILPGYLPPRIQACLKILGELAVLLTCFVLVGVGSGWAWQSFMINEHSMHQTEFNPTIWWFKALVPVGGVLLGWVSLCHIRELVAFIRSKPEISAGKAGNAQ